MPLTNADWRVIQDYVEKQIRINAGTYFTQGQVVSRDPTRNVVFLRDFGAQPIPLFTFNYEIKYYDQLANGQTEVRTTTAIPICPNVGDIVLVARQNGTAKLPKCLGVLRSSNFLLPEGNT